MKIFHSFMSYREELRRRKDDVWRNQIVDKRGRNAFMCCNEIQWRYKIAEKRNRENQYGGRSGGRKIPRDGAGPWWVMVLKSLSFIFYKKIFIRILKTAKNLRRNWEHKIGPGSWWAVFKIYILFRKFSLPKIILWVSFLYFGGKNFSGVKIFGTFVHRNFVCKIAI